MRSLLLALSATLAACVTPSPVPETLAPASESIPLQLGIQYQLASAILGDTREINVWTPPGYDAGREVGVIVYLLDGAADQDFGHIAGLADLGALSWTYEPMIIVGIQTKDRQHELTPAATDQRFTEGFPQAGGATDFRRFLAEEVRPFIEARYRPAPRTVLMGESLAGLFVTDTLLEQPRLFDDYIAISPSLWWDAGRIAAEAPGRLAEHNLSGRRLYMAMANEGGTMQSGIEVFRAAIGAAGQDGFEFIFSDKSATESHATIYHGEALAAFRRFYPLPPWNGETPWWMTPDGTP